MPTSTPKDDSVISFPVEGTVAPGFEAVRRAFEQNFTQGPEVGASLCVRQRGRDLVNLWGGFQNSACETPWQQDTLVNVFSTTKGVAALAFAAVVEAGHISYDDEVNEYWPEFVAARSGLTVGQLLSHQSGVPGVAQPISVSDMYNWPKMIGLLEAQTPFWQPGTAAGYHAVHWGFLVGELVLRTTGKTLGRWVADALATPLNAEFYLGLPAELQHRCADLIGPNRAREPAGDGFAAADSEPPSEIHNLPPLFPVALQNPVIRPYKDACSADWRSAEIAAANGQASGQGIAAIYEAAANGGLGGQGGHVRVLQPSSIAAAVVQEVGMETDLILDKPMRRGRGVILNTNAEYGPTEAAFGHAGAGGSLGFADPEHGLGFGYAMNQMQPGLVEQSRAANLIAALYDALQEQNA